MALIKCPECGNMVSDKAENCIHCGCPLSNGVLRISLNTFLKFIKTERLSIYFDNEFITEIKSGFYYDISVTPDETHTVRLEGKSGAGILHQFHLKKEISPGENRHIIVTYNDGNLIDKWEYREQLNFMVKK